MNVESRLAELLDRWGDAVDRGENLSPEQLCDDCPELLGPLQKHLEALEGIGRRLSKLRARPHDTADFVDDDELVSETLMTRSDLTVEQFHKEGGLGRVYVAADEQLNRQVALKTLKRGLASPETAKKQFLVEAEVTGRLEHPGIVPVHGIGHFADGRPFYTMRFIRGETLNEAIDRYHAATSASYGDKLVEFHRLLAQFVSVCKTIAYAHSRCILHRDIKPKNVMLGRYGETLMVDWGLAMFFLFDRSKVDASDEQTLLPRHVDQGDGSSRNGAGTPEYMSPEQASGAIGLGLRTDIFSLGATLYKIVTGKPPYAGSNWVDVKRKAIEGEFAPPRALQPSLSPALEAICLKAMSFRPLDRYATALELADDVERFLADEPVRAYREPLLRRGIRRLRRHRGLALSALAASLAVFVVCFGSAIWLGRMAKSEHAARAQAEEARLGSIRASAQYAAGMLARELDTRWNVLERAALSPRLRQLLLGAKATLNAPEARSQLQAWLSERSLEAHNLKARCWFLTLADGTQIARVPSATSIGQNYAFRDYFHGRGHDYPKQLATAPTPLTRPHRSAVYRSETTSQLTTALSVPVFDDREVEDRQVLAVLGMSVAVGDFDSLDSNEEGQATLLVDLRADQLEHVEQRGLVLHHPAFDEIKAASRTSNLVRLSADQCNVLARCQTDALKSGAIVARLQSEFVDPIEANAPGTWIAAAALVLPINRVDEPGRSVDWAVIVEQRRQP